jgi:hypothetical protein
VGRGWAWFGPANTGVNQPTQPTQPNSYKWVAMAAAGNFAHTFLEPGRLVWLATLGNANTQQHLGCGQVSRVLQARLGSANRRAMGLYRASVLDRTKYVLVGRRSAFATRRATPGTERRLARKDEPPLETRSAQSASRAGHGRIKPLCQKSGPPLQERFGMAQLLHTE